eukprot:CAMPEP_0202736402 /NCGR_PEP_ID=MMETSP1388-20130828/986_1 /ASSEMBLY_ACC=CAM_ASM_000864 /TAXON_ID=37098 /ORGANISM="Isochrysis sp, Strain CCMP1244" /LENGTH=557 /DNA_ID=CAMNT_0049402913 /DNA_START=72 /DNA_END=1741 /DNA_ORIENTATION=+
MTVARVPASPEPKSSEYSSSHQGRGVSKSGVRSRLQRALQLLNLALHRANAHRRVPVAFLLALLLALLLAVLGFGSRVALADLDDLALKIGEARFGIRTRIVRSRPAENRLERASVAVLCEADDSGVEVKVVLRSVVLPVARHARGRRREIGRFRAVEKHLRPRPENVGLAIREVGIEDADPAADERVRARATAGAPQLDHGLPERKVDLAAVAVDELIEDREQARHPLVAELRHHLLTKRLGAHTELLPVLERPGERDGGDAAHGPATEGEVVLHRRHKRHLKGRARAGVGRREGAGDRVVCLIADVLANLRAELGEDFALPPLRRRGGLEGLAEAEAEGGRGDNKEPLLSLVLDEIAPERLGMVVHMLSEAPCDLRPHGVRREGEREVPGEGGHGGGEEAVPAAVDEPLGLPRGLLDANVLRRGEPLRALAALALLLVGGTRADAEAAAVLLSVEPRHVAVFRKRLGDGFDVEVDADFALESLMARLDLERPLAKVVAADAVVPRRAPRENGIAAALERAMVIAIRRLDSFREALSVGPPVEGEERLHGGVVQPR